MLDCREIEVGGESFEVDFDDLAEGDVVQFQIYESQI